MKNRNKLAGISRFALITANLLLLLLLIGSVQSAPPGSQQSSQYFGSLIGKLNRRSHNVSGDVYAVDEQTLFIRNFNYDGLAPDAYFWSSVLSANPSAQNSFIVPDEKGSTKPLEKYQDKDLVLRLPEGKTLREINWLSVWSRQTKSSSGDIMIGRSVATPRPLEIAPLSQLAHGVRSGPITIVDAQTLLVPDFHYDGLGPAAYFWLTRGQQGLSPNGLRLKDENGNGQPLRKYQGETVVISLPDGLTVYDFDFFGLWCKEFQVNFGETRIPQSAKVPPSPKMLGIKPENKLNCEILYDELGYEIRWVLDGDDIVMQLVGKIEPNEYMAFGLGKDDAKSEMANADAVVSWVDRSTGQVHAVDYFLGAKQQCLNDPSGSCPDVKLQGGGDSLTLLHGAIVNGYSMVTFKRPQLGIDELYDQHVYSDGQQSVLWAIGVLNKQKEIGYHRLKTKGNMFIDFARNPQWNCPIPDLNASMHNNLPITSASQLDQTVVSASSTESSSSHSERPVGSSRPKSSSVQSEPATNKSLHQNEHWFIPSIVCPSERTFYAQIGPTAGQKGYEARTGRPNWGVAWYINGMMIPELVLERGQSYRFVVEGGNDKTSPSRRHPFYLTDSSEGGFDFKTDEERLKERIFAGVALRGDGQFLPTIEGRLCEWKPTEQTLSNADHYATFSAYQRSLKLYCSAGQASVLKFTPDQNTPDLIYYQCYTHRLMGWKIRVVNSCSSYLSARSSSNSMKRETRSSIPIKSEYKRRSTVNQKSLDSMSAIGSELRMNFDAQPVTASTPFQFPEEQSDTLTTTEMSNLPTDMLILNNSQLNQRQPFNLSNFEEVLKLSPADFEFIDHQSAHSDIPFQTFASSSEYPAIQLLPFQNFSLDANLKPINKTANSSNKNQKTLHSYMRRLASIYSPLQQQLASMLSVQSTTAPPNLLHPNLNQINNILQQQQQQQPQASEQSSSFSLSSLVPKSKIDLTKSNIGKKLNKLRFKSGRKYEPAMQSKPPTPSNEFNYDIFNNQLAQLEKQQKRLQSFDLSSWPQQPTSDSFNYLPLEMSEDPQQKQSMESMNVQPAQMIFGNLLAAQQYSNSMNANQNNQNLLNQPKPITSNTYQQPQRFRAQVMHPLPTSFNREPIRFSEIPLGPPNHLGQQAHVIDYLSMMFNNRTPNAMQDQQPSNSWQAPNEFPRQQQQQQQQAVYITRIPQTQILASQFPEPSPGGRLWPPSAASSFRHQPNQIHFQHNQPPVGSMTSDSLRPTVTAYRNSERAQPTSSQQQMSTMPSVSLTIYDSQYSPTPTPVEDNSESSSTSSLFYDSTRQPAQSRQLSKTSAQQASQDSDHMMAIERFSKQSSERRPPSVVHPITGEQVNLVVAPDEHRVAPDASSGNYTITTTPVSVLPQQSNSEYLSFADNKQNQIFDSDQSRLNDLQRINLNQNRAQQQSANIVIMSNDFDKIQRSGSSPSNPAAVQQQYDCNSIHFRSACLSSRQHLQQAARFEPTSASPNHIADLFRESSSQIPTSTASTSTIGPLIPSVGPPTLASYNRVNAAPNDGDNVISSTLIDQPIVSSLTGANNFQPGQFLNSVNLDSSPFTPVQLSSPQLYYHQQQHSAASNIINSRFKSPFIESMLSQQEPTFRPDPPVQVASYLAHHLTNHNPIIVSSDKQIAANKPMALSMSISTSNNSNAAGNKNTSNELIILKPAVVSKNDPQTYSLKPEYLTNHFKLINDNSAQLASSPSDQVDLFFSNDINQPSRRIAAHQFDRLSSLSSPPSTSISLDPMQAANTITTYIKQPNVSIEFVDTRLENPSTADKSNNTRQQPSDQKAFQYASKLTSTSKETENSTSTNKSSGGSPSSESLPQHRSTPIPSKSIPLNFELPAMSNSGAETVRVNPGGDNVNSIPRDNSTDNAILSHIMSLISSNAIPAPPMIPALSYSSADYFLPVGARFHRSVRG